MKNVESGDYVSHRKFPHVVWQVRSAEPWTDTGGEATLRYIGGKLTYAERLEILDVYENGNVAYLRNLIPANPMLVVAHVSK